MNIRETAKKCVALQDAHDIIALAKLAAESVEARLRDRSSFETETASRVAVTFANEMYEAMERAEEAGVETPSPFPFDMNEARFRLLGAFPSIYLMNNLLDYLYCNPGNAEDEEIEAIKRGVKKAEEGNHHG